MILTDDVVERVIFVCRQSLQTRMPLHVPHVRVDEVARDVGVAACNAALEAARYGELVEALKKLDVALTCRRDDDSHYCPNCDNSLFNERESIRALLSTIGESNLKGDRG